MTCAHVTREPDRSLAHAKQAVHEVALRNRHLADERRHQRAELTAQRAANEAARAERTRWLRDTQTSNRFVPAALSEPAEQLPDGAISLLDVFRRPFWGAFWAGEEEQRPAA